MFLPGPAANRPEPVWLILALAAAVVLFAGMLALYVVSMVRKSRRSRFEHVGFDVMRTENLANSNGGDPVSPDANGEAATPSPMLAVSEVPIAENAPCCGIAFSAAALQLAHRAGILGWLLLLGAIGAKIAGIGIAPLLPLACAAGLVGILAGLVAKLFPTEEARRELRSVLIFDAALFLPSIVWLALIWRHWASA